MQVQDQHQQQHFWNPAPGYAAMYPEAYQAYPGAAGDISAWLYACLNVVLTVAFAA